MRELTAVVKENTKQNPKIMADNIDFTKTILFQEGEEEGIIEGKRKKSRKYKDNAFRGYASSTDTKMYKTFCQTNK